MSKRGTKKGKLIPRPDGHFNFEVAGYGDNEWSVDIKPWECGGFTGPSITINKRGSFVFPIETLRAIVRIYDKKP